MMSSRFSYDTQWRVLKMWYICWKSKLTGLTGRGTMPLSFNVALDWLETIKEAYKDIDHWLEPALSD
jgi:hypothetical protein